MKSTSAGVCALCLTARELRESHFLPAALYRLVRATGDGNPHPVRLATGGIGQTALQSTHNLLCADCETRFDRNGENWVMKHCYRGRGVFRLRSIISAVRPIETTDGFEAYSASSVPAVDIGRLVYFCMSLFWRAAVRDWYVGGQKYEAISLGKRYQEKIRCYLLGETAFPECAVVSVVLSGLKTPVLTFNFPDTARVGSGYCHRLHIPGIDFLMRVGNRLDEERLGCIVHSPLHPVFVCAAGDRHVQREMLKLMGRVAPPGHEFPLIEGKR
jgi:hypothetical protein